MITQTKKRFKYYPLIEIAKDTALKSLIIYKVFSYVHYSRALNKHRGERVSKISRDLKLAK